MSQFEERLGFRLPDLVLELLSPLLGEKATLPDALEERFKSIYAITLSQINSFKPEGGGKNPLHVSSEMQLNALKEVMMTSAVKTHFHTWPENFTDLDLGPKQKNQ